MAARMVASLAVGAIVCGPAAAPARALEDPPAMTSTWDATVPPVRVTISAASHAPLPATATLTLEHQDDSPQGLRIQDALDRALKHADDGVVALGGKDDPGPVPLDVSYAVYVIPAGTPPKAARVMGAMEFVTPAQAQGIAATHLAGAHWGQPEGLPLGIDVTRLEGRGAPTGVVIPQDRAAFGGVLRLELLVRDHRDGTPLWSGWADSTLQGLRRDQVVTLLAKPVLATLGQTVAGHMMTIPVPPEMGGAER